MLQTCLLLFQVVEGERLEFVSESLLADGRETFEFGEIFVHATAVKTLTIDAIPGEDGPQRRDGGAGDPRLNLG